jgi:hypothetical protein
MFAIEPDIRTSSTVAARRLVPAAVGRLGGVLFAALHSVFALAGGEERKGAAGGGAGEAVVVQVADTRFSHDRGFYEEPFLLAITTTTPGAEIRYSTNGNPPKPTRGVIYTGPILIERTTTVRAIAHAEGLEPTNVDTHTYIFLDDVLRQPPAPEGFPARWGGEIEADYEMDPEVVGGEDGKDALRRALLAIPTLSIVMDRDQMFGTSGVYANGDGRSGENQEWERSASVELIHADGREGFQVDCGIRPHSHVTTKRSFKLIFASEYGESKLRHPFFQSAPLNGDSAVDEFDRLVLRAGFNRSWANEWFPETSAYTRDQWVRDSQILMSGIGVHGLFVHLYINGLYWGLYNPSERPDSRFYSSYFGGEPEDWFVADRDGPVSGDMAAYARLIELADDQNLALGRNYREVQELLDVEAFSDYLLLNWYAGTGDWPGNNWWGGNRNDDTDRRFRYAAWDAEGSFDDVYGDGVQATNLGAWVHPEFRRGAEVRHDPALIWQGLTANRNFLLTFADRAYRHVANGGALTDASARGRWFLLTSSIEEAILGESARWGDAREADGVPLRTRDRDWRPEVERVAEAMSGNAVRLVQALRGEEYYPAIDPPLLRRHGGLVPPGFQLVLLNPNPQGNILYTLDGSDPRAAGSGEASPAAATYGLPITIEQAAVVRARVRDSDLWSALAEAAFYTPQDSIKLRITEIMYHHPDIFQVSGDEYEFVELKNTGKDPLDLSGVQFTDGIDYKFPLGFRLEPAAFVVLVANPEEFSVRYPGVVIDGAYEKNLSNGGERVVLSDFAGGTIVSVTYDDEPPWPPEADGEGYSLVPVSASPVDGQGDPSIWRRSSEFGGSPGADDGSAVEAAPVITEHPREVEVTVGEPAVFQVRATGFPPPDYQWQKNGESIPGATRFDHVIASAALRDSGAAFRCVVSNPLGSVTSEEARLVVSGAVPVEGELVRLGDDWRYFKGVREPSPPGVWRLETFDDASWEEGPAPFGYGDGPFGTLLDDMQASYSSLYLRKRFVVPEDVGVMSMELVVDYDDGFLAWVNGTLIALSNVVSTEMPHDGAASRGHESGVPVTFEIHDPGGFVVPGPNVLTIHGINVSRDDSSDFKLDASLSFRGLRLPHGVGIFIRGDSNGDVRVNITDAVHMLLILFSGAERGDCDDAWDVNDDGSHNITDPLALLNFLFLGGVDPEPPHPAAGTDPTPDRLRCGRF